MITVIDCNDFIFVYLIEAPHTNKPKSLLGFVCVCVCARLCVGEYCAYLV